MKPLRSAPTATILIAALSAGTIAAPARGPLRVSTKNQRYFTDGTGKVVFLTGSHVWNNLVDIGDADPPPRFDFGKYLDFLQKHNHNFIRLWAWESVTWNTSRNKRDAILRVAPHPWQRTGPGKATDGKPRFDLDRFSKEYFDLLRSNREFREAQSVGWNVTLNVGDERIEVEK